MAIWFHKNVALSLIHSSAKGTIVEHLDIKVTSIGDDFIEGTLPVDHRTTQPMGLLHGGASCVLAETLGSIAANLCVDQTKFYAVGLAINTNHIRSARDGLVTGRATHVHLGKSTQVWEIAIRDHLDNIVSITRLTLAVKAKRLGCNTQQKPMG